MSNKKTRNTQLANEILMELITTYKESQIKIFLATINKFITKHYAIKRDLNLLKDNDDFDNIDIAESYDTLEIEIPLDFYKEYGGNHNYSSKEWKELVKSINTPITIYEDDNIRIINLIQEIKFNSDTKIFTIIFNSEYEEYMLLLRNSNYTIIDLEEIKQLNGKYEIGIYLAMWQFIEKGQRVFAIEECKKYFGSNNYENRAIVKELRKKINDINKKMGYKIELSTVIKNRKITNVILSFPKGRPKCKKLNP